MNGGCSECASLKSTKMAQDPQNEGGMTKPIQVAVRNIFSTTVDKHNNRQTSQHLIYADQQ